MAGLADSIADGTAIIPGRATSHEAMISQILNHKSLILNLFWWLFASLVAIAVVEMNVIAGLGFAIIGGVILGLRLFAK